MAACFTFVHPVSFNRRTLPPPPSLATVCFADRGSIAWPDREIVVEFRGWLFLEDRWGGIVPPLTRVRNRCGFRADFEERTFLNDLDYEIIFNIKFLENLY